MPNAFKRRDFLSLLTAAAGAACLGRLTPAEAGAAAQALRDLPELDADPAGEASFDVFYRLSQMVTCRLDLDRQLAERMFAVFEGEPWFAKHAATAYGLLDQALRAGEADTTVPELLEAGVLEGGERWFVSHLLTTWYLGVYYHPERENVRITYGGALMHDLVADYRPLPGFSDRPAGFWSERPEVPERLDTARP